MQAPIYINSGRPGWHVLITAGVHGDEYEPILAALELAKKIPALLQKGSVTIVPIVNTSAASIDNRLGADGCDLARICPGNLNGSASEISAAKVSSLIREADYYIDMHTGGKVFTIFPLAGYMLHSSADILIKQQNMAHAFNLPVVWGTDSLPNGRTLSVARDANVPAIYVEYGGGNQVQSIIIEKYEQGCLNVLRYLNMINYESIENTQQVKYWVEDYTPNNGHLQTKLPAPCEGIFIPVVTLGQMVVQNQLIGSITNFNTNIQLNVYADLAGMILFLRDAAVVKTGDSLGGILPVTASHKLVIHGK